MRKVIIVCPVLCDCCFEVLRWAVVEDVIGVN